MGPKGMPKEYPTPFERSTADTSTQWIYGDSEKGDMPGPASGSIIQFYGYDDSEALQGGIIAKVLDFDKVTGLLQLVFLGAEDEYLQWWLFSPAGEGGMSSNQKFHLCRCRFWECPVKNPSRTVSAVPYFHVDSFKILTMDMARKILEEWNVPVSSVLVEAPVRPTPEEVAAMTRPKKKLGKRGIVGLAALGDQPPLVKKKKLESTAESEGYSPEEWAAWEREQKPGGAPPGEKAAEGVLDDELRELSRQLGASGDDAVLKEQLADLQKRLGGTQGPSAKSPKKSTQELLVEKAKKEAELSRARATSSKELEQGSDSTVLVKFLRGVMKRDSDLLPSDDEFGDDEDAAPTGSPLKSKRALLRRLAAKRPGLLLSKGLAMMREQLQPLSGDADEEDALTPACVRYFMTVYLPNHRQLHEHQLREVRTLCEAIDGLLRGKSVRVLDLLMQRLKAAMMAYNDGSWSSARWLELLPPEVKASPISIDEEELVRKVQSGELSMQEMIRKVKDGKGGEKC